MIPAGKCSIEHSLALFTIDLSYYSGFACSLNEDQACVDALTVIYRYGSFLDLPCVS